MEKSPDTTSSLQDHGQVQTPEPHPPDRKPARERAAKEGKEEGLSGTIKKWAGVITAVLSVSSGIYGVLKFQAEKRERAHLVSEQLATARSEQAARNYAPAWEGMQQASKTAHEDGLLAKLLGGLTHAQAQVQTAQEDLAMEWLRTMPSPGTDPRFPGVADKVLDFLSRSAQGVQGARKADILAHIGWAYFGKKFGLGASPKDAAGSGDPEIVLHEALALDPKNPYANAFYGAAVLESRNNPRPEHIAEANQYFAAALTTPRARPVVRTFQLTALASAGVATSDWWRVVGDMIKQKEPLEPYRKRILSQYYSQIHNNPELKPQLAIVPAEQQVGLLRKLMPPDLSDRYAVASRVALAAALEAAGKPAESLAVLHELQASHAADGTASTELIEAAIKRLSAAHQG